MPLDLEFDRMESDNRCPECGATLDATFAAILDHERICVDFREARAVYSDDGSATLLECLVSTPKERMIALAWLRATGAVEIQEAGGG